MPCADAQALAHLLRGVAINEAGAGPRHLLEAQEGHAARIHHREIDQSALREFRDVGEAPRRLHPRRPTRKSGDRWIHERVGVGTDALDDARVDLPVVPLPPCGRVVGMHVEDGGARGRGGEAVRHDLRDRDRDAGLALPAPGAVQGGLDPRGRGHHRPCKAAAPVVGTARARGRAAQLTCLARPELVEGADQVAAPHVEPQDPAQPTPPFLGAWSPPPHHAPAEENSSAGAASPERDA